MEAPDELVSFDNCRVSRWQNLCFPALNTLRSCDLFSSSRSLNNYSSTTLPPSTSFLKSLNKLVFMDYKLKHHILSQITAQSSWLYSCKKGIRDFTKFSSSLTILIKSSNLLNKGIEINWWNKKMQKLGLKSYCTCFNQSKNKKRSKL